MSVQVQEDPLLVGIWWPALPAGSSERPPHRTGSPARGANSDTCFHFGFLSQTSNPRPRSPTSGRHVDIFRVCFT